MREIMHSKVLMLFIAFVVGIIYFNSCTLENEKVSAANTNNQTISQK